MGGIERWEKIKVSEVPSPLPYGETVLRETVLSRLSKSSRSETNAARKVLKEQHRVGGRPPRSL